jgi:hypothetical protein
MEDTIDRYIFCSVHHQNENGWNCFANSVCMYGKSNSKKGIIRFKSLPFHIFGQCFSDCRNTAVFLRTTDPNNCFRKSEHTTLCRKDVVCYLHVL